MDQIEFDKVFCSKNEITYLEQAQTFEIKDFPYETSNIKIVDFENKEYYFIEYPMINNKAALRSFFISLDQKRVISSVIQPRIQYYQRSVKLSPCFFYEKLPDDVFVVDLLPELTLEELIVISQKICLALQRLHEEFYYKDNSSPGFFFLTIHNLVYNRLNQTIKIIYYGFENSIVEIPLNINEEKNKRINFLPLEALESNIKNIDPLKLNIYITGSILFNIFSGRIPWFEINYSAVERSLKDSGCSLYSSGKNELINNISSRYALLNQNMKKIITQKIVDIIKLTTERSYKKRELTFIKLNSLLKDVLPYYDLINCDTCPGFREKSFWYCVNTECRKFVCELCKKFNQHKCDEGSLISIDSFIKNVQGQLAVSHNSVTQIDQKNFIDIQDEIIMMSKLNKERIREIECNDQDFMRTIERIILFKKDIREKLITRLNEENRLLKQISEMFEKTKQFKDSIVDKYFKKMFEIGEQFPTYKENFRLIKENFNILQSIERNMNSMSKNIIDSYYIGYDVIHEHMVSVENSVKLSNIELSDYFTKMDRLKENVNAVVNNTDEFDNMMGIKEKFDLYVKNFENKSKVDEDQIVEHYLKFKKTLPIDIGKLTNFDEKIVADKLRLRKLRIR